MKPGRLWGATALLSVSCAPAQPVAESAPPRPPIAAATAAPPSARSKPRATAGSKDVTLQERLSGALAYVSEIRHLAALSPVQGRLISREETARYLTAQLEEATPPDVI